MTISTNISDKKSGKVVAQKKAESFKMTPIGIPDYEIEFPVAVNALCKTETKIVIGSKEWG